jgi:thymidine phosphorylase
VFARQSLSGLLTQLAVHVCCNHRKEARKAQLKEAAEKIKSTGKPQEVFRSLVDHLKSDVAVRGDYPACAP